MAHPKTVRLKGTIACHKSTIEGNIRMAYMPAQYYRANSPILYKMSLGLANQSLFGSPHPTVHSRKYARMVSPN